MRYLILTFILFSTISVGTAFAEEEATANNAPAPADVKIIENPKMDKVRDHAEKLAAQLSPAQIQNLALVRDGFGMIRSVGIAHETVGDASKLCSEKNPDMAETIDARFAEWDAAISGAIKAQEDKMDAAISKPNFDNPKDIKAYLQSIDDAAEHAESNIDKQLITSPEACKNLRDSMDGTQETITKLLGEINWPGAAATDSSE